MMVDGLKYVMCLYGEQENEGLENAKSFWKKI